MQDTPQGVHCYEYLMQLYYLLQYICAECKQIQEFRFKVDGFDHKLVVLVVFYVLLYCHCNITICTTNYNRMFVFLATSRHSICTPYSPVINTNQQ